MRESIYSQSHAPTIALVSREPSPRLHHEANTSREAHLRHKTVGKQRPRTEAAFCSTVSGSEIVMRQVPRMRTVNLCAAGVKAPRFNLLDICLLPNHNGSSNEFSDERGCLNLRRFADGHACILAVPVSSSRARPPALPRRELTTY